MKFLYFFYILLFSLVVFSCNKLETEDNPPLIGLEGLSCFEDKTCENDLVCINDICEKDKCLNIECNEAWAECNSNTGKCGDLKEGFCLVDGHCSTENNEFCNQETYKCDKICSPNELRCNNDGSKIEKCNANNEWLVETTCDNAKVCSADFTCKNKCSSNSYITRLKVYFTSKQTDISEYVESLTNRHG